MLDLLQKTNPFSRDALEVFASCIVMTLIATTIIPSLVYAQQADFGNTNNPIEHIVVIMQENHSFDNYFGTYPGANGSPTNVCIPKNTSRLELGCTKPFLTTNSTPGDLGHIESSATVAINGGKMDGFLTAAHQRIQTMSYYDDKSIPYYWDLAKNYVLADNFFSSAPTYSLPNHWYAIAGQTPSAEYTVKSLSSFQQQKDRYLMEANSIKTIADELMSRPDITWKYYHNNHALGGYDRAVAAGTPASPTIGGDVPGSAYDFWDPFAAQSRSYSQQYYRHFVPRSQIFDDIKKGQLPNVSWVLPAWILSEHPPASIQKGTTWVKSVVDGIMTSKYWKSTAIIITWDEWGGFYDHVPPPPALGIRVPALIISPYAKTGLIDHTQYSFESILKFIESRFNVAALTNRDLQANNLEHALDFNQKPQPPHIVPLTITEMKYISPYMRCKIQNPVLPYFPFLHLVKTVPCR
jgi:phospholipase C